ncbi:MFS transporter [Filimonas effusa]|uniref:MFS transporter n=1 Tax=Filimonas effusa TaxID=2508721 RepID=A0A4Q1D8X6_9BACT|nr:MFS transporter [Filimonas effusa]RXK85761.1 MFS transporter [Filimonas effusa]
MKSKKTALWIILGIVLMNAVGMSVVLPLLPFLVGKYLPAQRVVVGMSALMSVFAVCTFFAAPVLGALSDRYGRKSVLIISLLGSVAGYILFGAGGALWILFLGRIIDGLTAGNISTLFAYISDTTEPEERTRWFAYIGSVMGMGMLAGPALGGLLGSISLSLPFFVTAGIIFLSALAVYFLLPESLPPGKRTRQLSLQSFNTFSHIKEIFRLKEVGMLLTTGVLFYTGLEIFQFNFTVFLKDVFKWGPAFIGGILTLAGACDIFSRALLLPFMLKHFSERRIGMIGLLILATGLISVLLSIMLLSVVFVALAVVLILTGEGLFDPTFNSNLSKSVDVSKQGKLHGVNQSLQSCTRVVVPLGAAVIYYYSPALLYAIAGGIILVTFVLYTRCA